MGHSNDHDHDDYDDDDDDHDAAGPSCSPTLLTTPLSAPRSSAGPRPSGETRNWSHGTEAIMLLNLSLLALLYLLEKNLIYKRFPLLAVSLPSAG